MASAIYVGENCKLTLEKSRFLQNSAKTQGTIYLEGNSKFDCRSCSFQSNRANESSVLIAFKNSSLNLSSS